MRFEMDFFKNHLGEVGNPPNLEQLASSKKEVVISIVTLTATDLPEASKFLKSRSDNA